MMFFNKLGKYIAIGTASIVLCSCASSEKESKTEPVNNEADITETEEKEIEQEVTIISATNFSSGYAWIELLDGSWYCIDESGREQCKLSCSTVTDNINGYAVVDSSYIVDNTGQILYKFEEEGYELEDSASFDVGRAVLSKSIDTFDKSGEFFYSLDIQTGNVEEIDFSGANYYTEGDVKYEKNNCDAGLKDYICNGCYTIALRDDISHELRDARIYETMQFYDVKTNRIVSIDWGKDAYGSSLNFYKGEDENQVYIFANDMLRIVDMNSFSIIKTVDKEANTSTIFPFGGDVLEYEVYGTVLKYYTGDYNMGTLKTVYFDLNTKELFEFQPQYEEEQYEVLDYRNGYFILSVKNDIGTKYLAVVSKDGKTVYEPSVYDTDNPFEPRFLGNDVVYYSGEKLIFLGMDDWEIDNEYEMNLSYTLVKEGFGDSGYKEAHANAYEENGKGVLAVMIGSTDDVENYILYDSEGNPLKEFSRDEFWKEGYSEGYARVWIEGEEVEFWDLRGEKLEIALND